jgi:hypothetical protein
MYAHPTIEKTVGEIVRDDLTPYIGLRPSGTPVRWTNKDDCFIDYHDIDTLQEAAPWWPTNYCDWPDEGELVFLYRDSTTDVPGDAVGVVLESNEFFCKVKFSDYGERGYCKYGTDIPERSYTVDLHMSASSLYNKKDDGTVDWQSIDMEMFSEGGEYVFWHDDLDLRFGRPFVCDSCGDLEDRERSWYVGDDDRSYTNLVLGETQEICEGCRDSCEGALEIVIAHGQEDEVFNMWRYGSSHDCEALPDILEHFVDDMKDWKASIPHDDFITLWDENDDMERLCEKLGKDVQFTIIEWGSSYYVHKDEQYLFAFWLTSNRYSLTDIFGEEKRPSIEALVEYSEGTPVEVLDAIRAEYAGVELAEALRFKVSQVTFETVCNPDKFNACTPAQYHFRTQCGFQPETMVSVRDVLDDTTLSKSEAESYFWWLLEKTDYELERTLKHDYPQHKRMDWLRKVITVSP